MASCIYFGGAHSGHNTQIITHQGKACLVCLDCRVMADLEAIGGHITPADAIRDFKTAEAGKKPEVLNQLSKGVTL